jgi:hypothetical protein
MDMAIEYNLSTKVIESLNRCRIYLQVITVSDIATADGKKTTNGNLRGSPTARKAEHLILDTLAMPSAIQLDTVEDIPTILLQEQETHPTSRSLGPGLSPKMDMVL